MFFVQGGGGSSGGGKGGKPPASRSGASSQAASGRGQGKAGGTAKTSRAAAASPTRATKPVQKRPAPGGAKPAPAPAAPPPAKKPSAKNRYRIVVHVNPDLPEAADDKFVLSTADGAWSQTKTIRDDKLPGNATLELEYRDLPPGQTFTLTVDPGAQGGPYPLFQNVRFDDLAVTPE